MTMTSNALYRSWAKMKDRCLNPKNEFFHIYGGRGITICDRWLEPRGQGFLNFFSDMGARPDGKTLDRRDNNLGYSPDNCRWATPPEQNRNMRRNIYVVIEGIKYLAIDLAQACGHKTETIVLRANAGLKYDAVVQAGKRRQPGGFGNGQKQLAKTHCPKGHEYTEENTSYADKERHQRTCKECKRAARKALTAKRKALESAA